MYIAALGIIALIPILDAFLGVPSGVLLLFVSPAKTLLFLVFLIVLQRIEGNVIYPKVAGRKIGLPGMWVLLRITVGKKLSGIWGILLAVPITTIFYQLLKKNVQKREQSKKLRKPDIKTLHEKFMRVQETFPGLPKHVLSRAFGA